MARSDKLGDVTEEDRFVTLGGKKYKCRFTFSGYRYLSIRYGSVGEALDRLMTLRPETAKGLNVDLIDVYTDFVYSSVLSDSDLSREEVETMLSVQSMPVIQDVIAAALADALPRSEPSGVDELSANFPQNGTPQRADPETQNGTGPI